MEQNNITRRSVVRAGTLAGLSSLAGCTTVGGVFDESNATNEQSDGTSGPKFYSSDATTGFGIDLQNKPLMGSPDARMDMYYWSDYLCPFCKRFEEKTFPKLIENYVSPGKLRVVFLPFPYIGQNSMPAAIFAQCVWQTVKDKNPNAFWDWHSAVFDAQQKPRSGWATRSKLLDITKNVEGIDASAVQSYLQNHRRTVKQSIQAEFQEAKTFGIKGTPAFTIYDSKDDVGGTLIGAQPYPRFEGAIADIKEKKDAK